MKEERKCVFLMSLVGWMIQGAVRAGIPEPDVILYREIRIDDLVVTASDDVSVFARLEGGAAPIGSYRMGESTAAGDLYVLRIRLESLADGSAPSPNAARVGDTITIFARASDGRELSQGRFRIRGRGMIERLNLPAPDGEKTLIQIAGGVGKINPDTGLRDSFTSPKGERPDCALTAFELELNEECDLVSTTVAWTGNDSTKPSVAGLDSIGGGRHTVNLARALEPGHWARLSLRVRGRQSGTEADVVVWVAHLPLDVNQDGTVNISDATAFGNEFRTRRSALLADINCDGRVNVQDATEFGNLWPTWTGRKLPEKPR